MKVFLEDPFSYAAFLMSYFGIKNDTIKNGLLKRINRVKFWAIMLRVSLKKSKQFW